MATSTAPQDLSALTRSQADIRPEQIALSFEGRETTYAELEERANRVANGLRAITPAPETRVAVLDKNSDAFFELLLGAAKARDVLVPVNWRLAPSEVAYILNDAMAAVLFVGEEFFPIVAQILPALRSVTQVIALSGTHPDWEPYTYWRDRQNDTDPGLTIAGDDVAVQLYTSGTTGLPKGAQLTHDNLFIMLAVSDDYYPCTAEDINLACMPQFHAAGMLVGLAGLYAGARNLIMRESVPAEILRLIPAERVTITLFVPALLLFLLQTPGCRETDFSSLRWILYGASPIPLDLVRQAMETFKCD